MAKKPAEKKMDKLVREKAVTKKDFTDKPAPEVWTESGYQMYLDMHKKDYEQGGSVTKEFVLRCLNELFDKVLSGEIIVQKEIDTE